MRKSFFTITLVFLINTSFGQQLFNSADDVQEHWSSYTSYQRDEMVSFCDFLFRENHFERCILTAFQLLYKFPNDELSSVLHYYIARSYDELENYSLADRYYTLASKINTNDIVTSNASKYRRQLVYLKSNQLNKVIKETEQSVDPYLLTFRGYAFLQMQDWEKARSTLITAEEQFNHSHYSDLMLPLYQMIDEVETIPKHNKYIVSGLGTIFPGGGHLLLKDWNKGKGVLATFGLLAMTSQWTNVTALSSTNRIIEPEGSSIPINNKIKESNGKIHLGGGSKIPGHISISSTSLKYTLPSVLFSVGIYIGSIWKSYSDTQDTNYQLISFYVENRLSKSLPNRFVDFPEPDLKFTQ